MAGFGSGSGKVAEHEHYEAEVNKRDLNMNVFTATLNRRWAAGWRLDHAFEQGGNTVVVWARREQLAPASSPTLAPLPPGTAAGWQPDPTGQAAHRWWDGSAWTEHTG